MDLHTTVKAWLMNKGRQLEIARYAYTFLSGSAEDVIQALKAYQNDDGGFAHGLEPDFWTPESNPIDTWTAINVMRSLALPSNHPLIQSTLAYLRNTPHKDKGQYYFRIQDNNNHPHAPWWHYTEASKIESYNPSASLYGFILKHEPSDSDFYLETIEAFEAMLSVFMADFDIEMHALRCLIELLADLEDTFDLSAVRQKLEAAVVKTVEHDSSRWFTDYCARPSQLIESPKTPGYGPLRHWVDLELEHMRTRQNSAGVWDLTWSWEDRDPEAFKKAEKAWQSIIAYDTLVRFERFKSS